MNLQSMLLIGLLMGNNVEADINHYENVYMEDYNQKQKQMYLNEVQNNPQDITALTELGDYYKKLWQENPYDFENFDKAEAIYKEIIEINPESSELAKFYLDAVGLVGYDYFFNYSDRTILYKTAEEECLRLLAIDSNNIETLTYLGDLYGYVYRQPFNSNVLDDLTPLDFFDYAEKIYFDILKIDENNIEARYKLIDLYENESENEWRAGSYSQGVDYIEYFKKIEQQYLDILAVDEDYTQARYDLINLYLYAYNSKDIDCIDKIEKQLLEISKRESKEDHNIDVLIKIGDIFKDIWYSSDYTNNEAFEKAEYYYNYALSISPNNSDVLYNLISMYESDYYNGNGSSEENFQKCEKLYREYLPTLEIYERGNELFDLALLYEDRWLVDKSDYTYYYMAENEFYNALDLVLNVKDYNIYWVYGSLEICMSLVEMYTTKYEFDGDTEVINKSKNLLLEQIDTRYTYETSYIEGEYQNSYVDKEKLMELSMLYYNLWLLDTSDMQYYYRTEKTLLKLLDMTDDYQPLLLLCQLYDYRFGTDDDIEALNKSKNVLLEQISNKYSAYEGDMSHIDNKSPQAYVNKVKFKQLGNTYYYIWKLDTDDMQYYEKAEKMFLKSQEVETDYEVLFRLGELYTDRWLLDKSDVQYKVKALECFNEILANDDELSYGFWLEKEVYPWLEKLEL